METTLAKQPQCGSRSDRETDWSPVVADLRDELAELRKQVASWRQQVGYWKSMHARAVEKNWKLEREMDLLRAENRKLKDKVFGRRTEKTKHKDRSNHLDDPQETSEESKRQRGRVSYRTDAQPRSPRGTLRTRCSGLLGGRSVFGLQGDGSSQVGRGDFGLLLGACAT